VQQAKYWAQATGFVAIVNCLLAVGGTLASLFVAVLVFPRLLEMCVCLVAAGFFAATATLFYQCIRASRVKPTPLNGRVLFSLAGLYQLLVLAGTLALGGYLLVLNTHDPVDWDGDRIDLTGWAATCFALSLWPPTEPFSLVERI
jgi:hypothetical protein